MIEKSYKLRIKEKTQAQPKKNNEHYTPLWVIRKTAGFPDYDPATNKEKADEFGVKNYDTITTNGLIQDWSKYKNIWINPPFTLKKEFTKKAVQTVKENNNARIFVLMPIESLTTKWFYSIESIYNIYLPEGRIKFENPLNPSAKSPAFGSVIIEFGKNANGSIIKIKE